jgi:hypothetical protein
MGWWSNNDGTYTKLSKDALFGSGAGHQIVLVVPSMKLIMVRNGDVLGETRNESSQYHELVRKFLFEPLMDAILADGPAKTRAAPYPPSQSHHRHQLGAKRNDHPSRQGKRQLADDLGR